MNKVNPGSFPTGKRSRCTLAFATASDDIFVFSLEICTVHAEFESYSSYSTPPALKVVIVACVADTAARFVLAAGDLVAVAYDMVFEAARLLEPKRVQCVSQFRFWTSTRTSLEGSRIAIFRAIWRMTLKDKRWRRQGLYAANLNVE